jgi:hypothetical protein
MWYTNIGNTKHDKIAPMGLGAKQQNNTQATTVQHLNQLKIIVKKFGGKNKNCLRNGDNENTI